MLASNLERALEKSPEVLSKPVEVRVNVSGFQAVPAGPVQPLIPPSPISGPASRILSLLADKAAAALRAAAESKLKDVVNLPTMAAEEFVKSVSGEAGKGLVHGFRDLITSGFTPSSDKDTGKDTQLLTTLFVREIIREPAAFGLTDLQALLGPTKTEHVYFETNQARLTTAAYEAIDRVRIFVRDNPDSIILLSSNADTTGSAAFNRELARQRSTAIRNSLVSSGVGATNRIFIANLANDSLPVITSPNASEPRNRSVTIEVRR